MSKPTKGFLTKAFLSVAFVVSAAGVTLHAPDANAGLGDVFKGMEGHAGQVFGANGKIIEGQVINKGTGAVARMLGVGDEWSDCVGSASSSVYSSGNSSGANSASNTAQQTKNCVDQKHQAEKNAQAAAARQAQERANNAAWQEQQRSSNAKNECDNANIRAMRGDPNAKVEVENCKGAGWTPPRM
jgi:hypothetical protein